MNFDLNAVIAAALTEAVEQALAPVRQQVEKLTADVEQAIAAVRQQVESVSDKLADMGKATPNAPTVHSRIDGLYTLLGRLMHADESGIERAKDYNIPLRMCLAPGLLAELEKTKEAGEYINMDKTVDAVLALGKDRLMKALDIGGLIDEALGHVDIEEKVAEAIENYDLDDLISNAVSNFDFSDAAEDAVSNAIDGMSVTLRT